MPVATMSYPSNHSPTASSQQQQQQHASPLPPPAREFLVNVEMWCTFGSLKQSKNKVKSNRSRPSSSIFTGSGSASASQDDLALAHSLSATTDGYSHYSVTTSNNSSNASKKTGISSLFSSSSTASELGGMAGHVAERAAKAGAAGFWRGAVCKLSGEGGAWPGSNSATPTGSALLTIYSSDDNTLQHVINVHKLTSTDVRSTDKSLFGRSDVLAIWGHPAAMSLTTHPTLDPIYLSFSSPDAHNTWLVLLRSYTSPEIYGRMIAPEKSTGGLYRMWRQIEMVVVQSRGVGLSTPASLLTQTPTHVKERKSIGGLFGKEKDLVVPGLHLGNDAAAAVNAATSSGGSRPGTATSNGTSATGLTSTSGGTATDIIPLGLTSSHTPSVATGSTSFISTTGSTASTEMTGSGGHTPMQNPDPHTPIARTISLRSFSTSSLPTSESDANNGSGTGGTGHSPITTTTARDLAKAAKEKEKEREKREKERERERKEKERKEKEKQREREKRKVPSLPAFFAEIVLDGEVCGRTTVKRPPPPLYSSASSSSAPSGRPSTAPSGPTPSHASLISNNNSAQGPEWFENFLFGDLPSFGNMLVSLWKAPEKGSKDEKDRKPGTSNTTTSSGVGSSVSAGSNTLNNQSVVSGLTNSSAGNTSTNSRSTAATGKKTLVNGTASSAVTMYGGAKGTQFLGCVEISIPNFRRGEWVEGWWPVYAHANSLTGGVNKDGIHHSGGISQLGMGMGAMGMGGMSGVGGVAGAMVQVGELKLKIKVDEEIILPSKAYKNVLDALEQRNYLDVLSDLEQKLRIDHAMISNHIVSLAVARNRLLKDIVQLAEREVNAIQGSTNTLFRGNTVLTKTMELAMAWYGRGFLDASVGPIIRRMIAENVEIEVDPARLPHTSKRTRPGTKESLMNPGGGGDEKETLQEQGIRLLEYWCNEFWSQIYFVRMECPVELRRLFGHIRMMVERRFNVSGRQFDFDPNDPTSGMMMMNSSVGMGADMLPWQAISSFVFLRFIVPAVLNPHLFGICPGMPPKGVVRSLTLLAKCTQSLANLNPGAPPKEEYMRGIRNCLERNTVTMIDYLGCVSSLPDQFSPTANSSSFLSGPDKHDRLHVINSLRERLTGAGNTIPTLYKDAIPLLPYALDVPKHLAILSSAVVRNSRSGGGAGLYGGRTGSAGVGAEQNAEGGWNLSRFSDLCFDVEAQALKSVATLAQGAASAGAFGPRTKRSTSVSSTGGLNGQQQHGRPGSSRGITPTGAPATSATSGGAAGNSSPAMATTPTQTSPAPWNNQVRRPASSRSIVTPTGAHVSNASPGPSPGGNGSAKHSPGGIYNQASGSPMGSSTHVVTLMPPTKRKSSARPSTAPSSTSAGTTPNDSFIRERKVSNTNQGFAVDASPAAASFRYLPPEQPSYPPPHETRAEDSGMPETPISSEQHSPYGSTGRKAGYPTMHRAESETYVPFHYPSRYQGSAEGLRPSGSSATEKSERRSSRIRDFMRRPATSSGSPSVSAPASATDQRPPWTWGGTADAGVGHRQQLQQQQNYTSGDDFMNSPSRTRGTRNASGSIGNSSGENGSSSRRKVERTDTAASGEQKKKKGLFGWLKK